MNRQIRQVAFLVVVMFAALALSVTSVQGLARPAIWEPWSANGALNSDGRNSRTTNRDFDTDRGPIMLAGGTTIASTEKSEDGQGSESYQRIYANGPLYAPVTGYFSPAIFSMSGIEEKENAVLNGDDPSLFSSRIKTLVTGGSQRGGAVELTIKPEIQQAAYEALGNREGAVVALDPSTGAVLALVSSPSYDPKDFASPDANAVNETNTNLSEDSSRPLENRAIAGNLYPPGSTFKIITTAAALRTGKVTQDQEVDAPDTITLPGTNHSLENYGGESCGGERTTFSHAFAESCNTPFAQLAMDVGEDELAKEAHNWGFDSELSIPLRVTPSTYPDNETQAQTAKAGIGQESVRATPLMMAMVAATVANNGEQMTPYLVSRTLDPDLNEVSTTSKKVARTPIDSNTAKSLSSLMQNAVADGTGTSAQVSGVKVAGKTGTAETGSDSGPTTWFVGFAGSDIDKPEIALAVVLDGNDKTEDGATGGKVAGPVAAEVIEAAVNQ